MVPNNPQHCFTTFHNLFCQSCKKLWISIPTYPGYRQQSAVQKQAAKRVKRTVATSMVFRTTSTNSLRASAIIGPGKSGNVATSWDLPMFYQFNIGTHQNDHHFIWSKNKQNAWKCNWERILGCGSHSIILGKSSPAIYEKSNAEGEIKRTHGPGSTLKMTAQ